MEILFMRKIALFLFISFLLFSCSKENDRPDGNPGGPSGSAPTKPAPPVTKVTIMINDTAMDITSLSFERYGSGNGGGVKITASNAVQKVMAATFNWYQQSPWGMIYQEEVSYFTRADSLADWGEGYTRPVPRDDRVSFDNFTPLADSVVTGAFGGTFNGGNGNVKTGVGQAVKVQGSFKLVFIK